MLLVLNMFERIKILEKRLLRMLWGLGVRHRIPLLVLISPIIVLRKMLVKNLVIVELADVLFELSWRLCRFVLLKHISTWNASQIWRVCEIISLSNWSPTLSSWLCVPFLSKPNTWELKLLVQMLNLLLLWHQILVIVSRRIDVISFFKLALRILVSYLLHLKYFCLILLLNFGKIRVNYFFTRSECWVLFLSRNLNNWRVYQTFRVLPQALGF